MSGDFSGENVDDLLWVVCNSLEVDWHLIHIFMKNKRSIHYTAIYRERLYWKNFSQEISVSTTMYDLER